MNELITQLQAALTAGQVGTVDLRPAYAVLPPGYSLDDLERFQDAPVRLRGAFGTPIVDAFCQYVTDHAAADTAVFIDPATCTARARLDHGDRASPGWGDHRATLAPDPTPLYKALLELHGARKTATDLIDWIIDWRDALAFWPTEDPEGAPTHTVSQAVQALRKLSTIVSKAADHTEDPAGRSRTVLEQARITSDPPYWMRAQCVPYDDLPPREFRLRLGYLPQDPPLISVRIEALGLHREQIAAAFAARVRDGLTLPAERIYLGTFK